MRIIGHCRHVLPALLVTSVFMWSAPDAHAGLLGKLKKKLDKTGAKVDKTTDKVTRPVDEANAKVDQAVGETLSPIDEANSKIDEATGEVLAPIVDARSKINDAQTKAMAPVVDTRRKIDGTKNRALAPLRQVQGGVNQVRQTPEALKMTAQARAQAIKTRALRPVAMTQQQVAAMRSQLMSAERLTDSSFLRDAALSRFKLDALAGADGKTLRLTGTVATAAQKLRAQQLAGRNFKTVINQIRVAPLAKTGAKQMIVNKMNVRKVIKSNKVR